MSGCTLWESCWSDRRLCRLCCGDFKKMKPDRLLRLDAASRNSWVTMHSRMKKKKSVGLSKYGNLLMVPEKHGNNWWAFFRLDSHLRPLKAFFKPVFAFIFTLITQWLWLVTVNSANCSLWCLKWKLVSWRGSPVMIRKYALLVLNMFTQRETIRKDSFMFSSASNDDKLYFYLTKKL